MRIYISILLLVILQKGIAQIGLENWREHLPYSNTIAVSEGNDGKIYCATPFSLFYYDKKEDAISRLSKINGLSDVNISTMSFDKSTGYLVVAYENANIDLIKNESIYNISDIKRKLLVGSKRINKIIFKDKLIYLACDFGIVVLNPKKKEIKDTYFIGPNGKAISILDLDYDDSLFYAATSEGIYTANNKEEYLSNYKYWHKDNTVLHPNATYNCIAIHSSGLYINKPGKVFSTDTLYILNNNVWKKRYGISHTHLYNIKTFGDTIFFASEYQFKYFYNNMVDSFIGYTYGNTVPNPSDIIIDSENKIWIADRSQSLVENKQKYIYKFYKPSGPAHKDAYKISYEQGKLWVAGGGIESNWSNAYKNKGIYSFQNEKWSSYNSSNSDVFDTITDIMKVITNPNDLSETYIASWGKGIIKMKNNKTVKVFNKSNSTLQDASNYPGFIGVAGLNFDDKNYLWATNSFTPNALHFMKPNGKWYALSLYPYVTDNTVGDFVIDDIGQKWIILPRGGGILVYNDNNTPEQPFDDRIKKLNTSDNNGKLPNNAVYSLAKDNDGNIWVGTNKGVAVFYSPGLVFSGDNFDAQQIYIKQEGISLYLLESEVVTSIAVDGANRIWFGTQNAGVFLMADNASKQIYHFTTENSPLLSNRISSIAIDDNSGEVFFGTENGIISFRSTATKGAETQKKKIEIFPNPVRPEYNGYIAIKGLIDNANVKITDISGNLVYETNALGGQAIWNGKNFNNERVATGVYLVFVTDEDLEDNTAIGKILFVK